MDKVERDTLRAVMARSPSVRVVRNGPDYWILMADGRIAHSCLGAKIKYPPVPEFVRLSLASPVNG